MKRGMWILATGAVVTTALTLGLAQERGLSGSGYEQKRRNRRPAQFFSRGRSNRSSYSLKNTTDSDRADSSPRRKTVETIGPNSRVPQSAKNSASPFPQAENNTSDAGRTTVTAGRKGDRRHPLDESGSLVHAKHERNDAHSESRHVRQVAGKQRRRSPFSSTGPAAKTNPRSFHLSPPIPNPPVPETPKPKKPKATAIQQTSHAEPAVATTVKAPVGPQSPKVTVKWVKTAELNVGQKCPCELVVTNTGTIDARDVLVEASFPASVQMASADPAPSDSRRRAVWKLDSLKPGEEKVIAMTLIPSRRGSLAATASVRFTGLAASDFTVKEPMLNVDMSGPSKVLVGDAASQFIVVSNPGTGLAKNVAVEAWIPAGLEHPRGERLIMEIGALNPGESRKVRLSLTAVEGGKQTIKVKATGDAALPKTHKRVVAVAAPSIAVAMKGPGLRYVGRNAVYTLKIQNDGSIATNNVRVLHKLPDGFEFIKADKGGSYDRSKRSVGWFIGRVEPGQVIEVKSTLAATKLGAYTHRAGAISEQGARSETSFKTKVDGTASLMVEIVDLDDPVEVGTDTAYEIRVRNEGTKAAGNVGITCEIPAGVELISAKGPARSTAKGRQVIFSPFATLAPGKAAIYRVHVRGKSAGNLRFRARLTSDTIKNPLTSDELTKFYGE